MYASDQLKSDRDVVLAAVNQSIHAWEFIENAVFENNDHNKNYLFIFINATWFSIESSSRRVSGDKDVVLAAVSQHGMLIRNVLTS